MSTSEHVGSCQGREKGVCAHSVWRGLLLWRSAFHSQPDALALAGLTDVVVVVRAVGLCALPGVVCQVERYACIAALLQHTLSQG